MNPSPNPSMPFFRFNLPKASMQDNLVQITLPNGYLNPVHSTVSCEWRDGLLTIHPDIYLAIHPVSAALGGSFRLPQLGCQVAPS
ncbi:MAG: hypothetical protein F6K19_41045 [Cyanothece sp. SIO1E1]|nr:hypothetical protein [Cyanothece sp. SIO1E1]